MTAVRVWTVIQANISPCTKAPPASHAKMALLPALPLLHARAVHLVEYQTPVRAHVLTVPHLPTNQHSTVRTAALALLDVQTSRREPQVALTAVPGDIASILLSALRAHQ